MRAPHFNSWKPSKETGTCLPNPSSVQPALTGSQGWKVFGAGVVDNPRGQLPKTLSWKHARASTVVGQRTFV